MAGGTTTAAGGLGTTTAAGGLGATGTGGLGATTTPLGPVHPAAATPLAQTTAFASETTASMSSMALEIKETVFILISPVFADA